MTARTIKRRSPNARQTAGAQAKARKVKAAKAKTGSALAVVMSWVPLNEDQLHKLFLALILGGAMALAVIVAVAAGFPALASQQISAAAAGAGFEVRRVEVRGVKRLNELKVYERALAQRNLAMPLVDVDALRAELTELSWVQDARVSRQLPDTLVIDIVERRPHAVLRMPDHLMLIDETGHPLEPISAARAKGKLILSGLEADKQVGTLSALLEAAPALRPQGREAAWLGNRRWNLVFKSGQVLALPEGEKQSAAALVAFARLDGTNRLLGGKVAAFDMRAPDRIYMRIPGRADREIKDIAAAKAAKAVKATATAAAAKTQATASSLGEQH
jgi:cell division protein FtsQ